MNNNASKIVTHGLGPSNDLAGLMTLGLNANPTFSGLNRRSTDVKSRIDALDVDKFTETILIGNRVDEITVRR